MSVIRATLIIAGALAAAPFAGEPRTPLLIDYPEEDSIFAPDMAAPTFLWLEQGDSASSWKVEVSFADGWRAISREAAGDRMQIGTIDPRCVGPTNVPPTLTPEQAASRTWRPDDRTWAEIKAHSVEGPAAVTITGYRGALPVSQGSVRIRTSRDAVGAPIFYRDVPLMPSELEKGVIKPLAPKLLPFIAWRLRWVDQPASRVVMEGLHTCANCHSFSRDGKTLGLDLDGPHNDKGLYAIVPVGQRMSIGNENVISWKNFRNQMSPGLRIGFMSQVSPDGRYVVTATQVEYYVANYKDYRFLQTFYPTRGILAWYRRVDGRMHALPGADDPRYVQANAVWSPDGSYLVFARAEARDSYPPGRKLAEYSGDQNEVQIQYDLYRIPFNNGLGGKAEPVAGASANGMSNSFPKISPDGRWMVFVKSRNGQLMRRDGQLYIVPAAGGQARRMRCNTALMNSWHSFSPNGRWMVFSSKSRSPYTQMFLTHIDEEGNDSPAILIEDSTAANRAVNIPEFVNIPRDGMLAMDAPAAEFYKLYDLAYELTEKGRAEEAVAGWKKALELNPSDAKAHNNIGGVLLKQGKLDEAAAHFRRALESEPELFNARDNLGLVLLQSGKVDEAVRQWRRSLETNPSSVEVRVNLGGALLMQGKYAEALVQLRGALRLEPDRAAIMGNLAWLLATSPDARLRNGAEAVALGEKAAAFTGRKDAVILDTLGAAYAEAGRFTEAVRSAREALSLAEQRKDAGMAAAVRARIALFAAGRPYRESR